MPAIVTVNKRAKLGNALAVIADVAFDSSYPAGGEPLTAQQFGLSVLHFVLAAPASGRIFEFDHGNNKLKAYDAAVKTMLLSYGGKDIKGSANTDQPNDDQAAAPTNGTAVAAVAAVAAGAWAHGALTSPDQGRNVCITIQNDSGGSLDLYEGAMKFTVTGTWRGVAQTEDITITSSAANKAVANTKFRFKYGVKPFDTVTNIVVDHVPADGLKIGAGLGSKIGLPNDLLTPAEADVVKITKTAADLAATDIVDTTNMTVNLGTLADGNDFNIVYKAAGEEGNTANMTGVTARVVAFGY